MVMITTKEYAEIRGCSETYVNRLVRTGKIKSISTTTDKNVKKNLIPLDQFTDDIKLQYYKSNNIISTDLVVDDISQFESLSMEEREECSFWIKIIEEWQSYRNKAGFGKKIEVDELFIAKMKLEYPDINISYNN